MKQAPRGMLTDGQDAAPVAPRIRSTAVLLALAICAALVFAGFAALGTWQLKRLQWKLALIERVEQRVHAPAVAAPGPERWPQINADADEYRRVRLSGTYLYALTARVQASTELGGGFWLLTPLRCADGSVVLVNRGFVPAKASAGQDGPDGPGISPDASPDVGPAEVSGLLRMSEPGGGFLRHNDPAGDRWFSRDVQAIAAARNLTPAAPYFIDADAATASRDTGGNRPVGGLTVIAFHNNHLVYALTWYALALMVAGAGFWVGREERNLRRRYVRGYSSHAGANAGGIDRESEDGK